MLEHSPAQGVHFQAVRGLEHSLFSSELGKWLKAYLLSCRVDGKSPLTIEHYGRRVGAYIRFTPDKTIQGISAYNVRLFIASLQESQRESSTIHAFYRALHSFFNWLIAENVIEKHPMANIKPCRLTKKTVRPFTDHDIKNLLIVTGGDTFLAMRNRAMILLLLDTGLRLAELASIKLQDIDFNVGVIKILGKGFKERKVRMGQAVQKAILKYLLARKDGHDVLWITEEHHPITQRGIQVTLKRLCHRAEITDAKCGPHTFRHTAAIQCLRNGMGEFTLQLMLGHSTLAMTRRYVSSLSQEDVFKAHQKASPVDNMRL